MFTSNRNYFFIVFILAAIIKVSLYYNLMDITINVGIKILLSCTYIVPIYTLLKSRKKCFFAIYLLISLLMFGDVIYFKYFNESLTLNIFGQRKQLTDVTETIKLLINPKDFLLFLDVFFLYFYFKNSKHTESNIINKSHKLLKSGIILASIVFVIVILINPFNSDVIKGIHKQEFFTYHIKDIYSAINKQNHETFTKNDIAIDLNKNQDITENKKLYGITKGRNLIVIQVESLQNMVINKFYEGQELTPNLNKLIKGDTIYFNNYYQQLGKGNTSDAEFVSQNSIYAPIFGQAYEIYKDNYFYGLPWIMRDEDYRTIAFHGYKKEFWNRDIAYPGQGFETFISEEDYDIKEKIGFGLTDREFFKQSLDYIKEIDKPFYGFFITLTNHNPYSMPDKYREIELRDEDKNTLFGDYLQAVHYTDKAIGEFISYLKDNNLYDNSIIAIYGDHFGLNCKDENINKNVSDFLGYDYDFDEMMKIPLIINIPGKDVNQIIETVGGQIDFMPTILNLMGIENKNPVVFGQDLVNAKSGFVASQTYMLKGSFIQGDIVFEMSRDGVFKNSRAWNKATRESVDLEDCREGYEKAMQEIDKAMYVLENDILRQVLKEKKDIDDIKITSKEIEPPKLIAHAGGRIQDLTYTNCKEALDKSYKNGYRFIEVDFEWTTDGEPVLLHSWDGFVTKFFGVEAKRYSFEEFKNFNMINNWHQMTLPDLVDWIKKHPDVYIVTDVKGNNIKLLSLISENYPEIVNQIVPQIYFMDEYIKARYLGYKNIIYTLYRSQNTFEEIIDFAKHNKLLAITMPVDKAETDLPKRLDDIGVFTYCHTINDLNVAVTLQKQGIDGFYTDDLTK